MASTIAAFVPPPGPRERRRAATLALRATDRELLVERLTKAQGGRCAACGESKPLCLDHDHDLNEPRALLCSQCNAALGLMYESPEKVAGLFRYAEACRRYSQGKRRRRGTRGVDALEKSREIIECFRRGYTG